MRTHSVPFFSNGYLLDADLHLPDDGGASAPYPAVVACSGFEGLKTIHPERFARALTPLGYAVMAFDYRGFGLSEGERGRLVPQEWVEDVREAVSRLSLAPEVDPDRIALLGWALGGGVVVSAAGDDLRVRGVVVANGIGNGERSLRTMHDDGSWQSLLNRIDEDRRHRVTYGRSIMTSPWDVVRIGTGTPVDSYVEDELYQAHGFGSRVTLESADYLLRFRPETVVDRVGPRPLLLTHGRQNLLHRPQEAEELYRRATEPKRIEMLEETGHTEWMFDDHPTFQHVVTMADDFLGETFAR
ncbi:MAG TPA: alpha/beta fold hydrolase [Jiangellaceae bacterium]|nr:alpha/beta fold hydrolase [Jiangellaceae bacterium]